MTSDEQLRLEALRDYEVLDTPPEEPFDNIVALAARLLETPIALVSLIDRDRQWFKARVGLDASETPRDVAFCDHAIRQSGPMTVADTLLDPRFANNPLVTGSPEIRFYCGVPLRTPEGHGLGTLCVIDRVPRSVSPLQAQLLSRLARIVEDELELRRRLKRLGAQLTHTTEVQRSKELLASMLVHDLRSPLSAVGMLTDVLAAEHPASRPLFEEMQVGITTMRRMLSDVLDLCLGEGGHLKPRTRRLVTQALLAELEPSWRRAAQHASQTLELELPGAAVSLVADPDLLQRVLTNLVTNAIQYGSPGQRIIVGARQRPDGAVEFEVSDGCPQIPVPARELIFRPFERGAPDSGVTGYGLGLAFCRLAVEAHRGSIAVAPTERGNRFYFVLPAQAP